MQCVGQRSMTVQEMATYIDHSLPTASRTQVMEAYARFVNHRLTHPDLWKAIQVRWLAVENPHE